MMNNNKTSEYLVLLGVILLLAACAGGQSPAMMQAQENAKSESADWKKCEAATGIYDCQVFLQKFPISYYASKAAKKIRLYEQEETKKKEERASALLETKFQRDSQLPAEMRRDKYMVALTAHLKNERYSDAMQYFEWLERLNTPLSDSFNFFYGEALLKTGQPTQAIQKLYAYITKAGSTGKYYKRALELANEAEAIESTSGPSTASSNINCPELSMPLQEAIPESVLYAPGITFNRLTCFYGANNQIKVQLAYPVGAADKACTDPNLRLNPKLNPNYRYTPVAISPTQELFIFGFGFSHVGGEDGSHVGDVFPGSSAEKAGLLKEDFIVAIDGDKKVVGNKETMLKELSSRDEVTLSVMRQNQLRDINMKKFKFLAPKSVMLSNEGVLGNVILVLPGQINDTQPLIDQGKILLDSVSRVAIRCN